jgi:hypothetical protein
METVAVIGIVVVAAAYIATTIFRKLKGGDRPGVLLDRLNRTKAIIIVPAAAARNMTRSAASMF